MEGENTQQYVKYNRQLHGERGGEERRILTTAFLKKFIKYAKTRYQCEPSRLMHFISCTPHIRRCFNLTGQAPHVSELSPPGSLPERTSRGTACRPCADPELRHQLLSVFPCT